MDETSGSRSRGAAARRTEVAKCTTAVLCLWVILILAQSCCLSSAGAAGLSPSFRPRTGFLNLAPVPVVLPPSTEFRGDDGERDPDLLIADEKRKVHTGPNPLHNK
ncbi:hypothetical protein H6P81_014962 [Aristolochia fimbriata]|uniref:Uncharacterized protein n=1 Tax=Aristolochia fimbriata TaxID=158543 RepID=A0AAV7E804_ARIFI|nr:hypothetical protein H6P81_014962 [Aristolochia fimbriata]